MIFLLFGSSLAHLEPKLQLFEVWEINVRQIIIIANGINSQTSNGSSSGSRQAREEPKKKENHQHTISKMMGTLHKI